MKEFSVGGHTFEVYDDIEQMNVVRYHKFSKMCALESGIGSDMSAVMGKIGSAIRHINDNKPKNAVADLKNLAITLDFTNRCFDPHSMAFAALVKSMDGKPCEDLSDDGLAKLSGEISRIFTKAGLDKEVLDLKKK